MTASVLSESSNVRKWTVQRVHLAGARSVVNLVETNPNGSAALISPARSLKVFNHSPDGFEFGYGGSGPAQLALAILLRFFGDEDERAVALHQDFKWKFISGQRGDGFEISAAEIAEWVAERGARR